MIKYDIQDFDDVTFRPRKFQSVKPDEVYFDLMGGYRPPYMNYMDYELYLYSQNFSDQLVFQLSGYPEILYPGIWRKIAQTLTYDINTVVHHDIQRINSISEIP